MLGLFGRFVIAAITAGMKSALPYASYLLKGKLSHVTVPSGSRGSLGPGQ